MLHYCGKHERGNLGKYQLPSEICDSLCLDFWPVRRMHCNPGQYLLFKMDSFLDYPSDEGDSAGDAEGKEGGTGRRNPGLQER